MVPPLCSAAAMDGQDWTPVILSKRAPTGAATKTKANVNAAARSGNVEHNKKMMGGENKSAHGAPIQNARKLDDDDGSYQHAKISQEFKVALMQARTAKKMTQAQLAQAINEKPSVINDYESGRAIPAGPIIQKLGKALGTRLPKAKAPGPPKTGKGYPDA